MGKTVVIFGAGASHDSVATHHVVPENLMSRTVNNQKPPLTKDIFDPLYLQKYTPDLRGVRNIASRFLSAGGNLEDYLTNLYQDAKSGKMTRYGQDVVIRSLIETMCYLSVLFLNHTRTHIRTTSNYHALAVELVSRQEDVTFITLNYDSLLERAIGDQGIVFNNMQEYTGQRIQVIKVHGSCDWNYSQRIDPSVTPRMYVNATDGTALIAMLDSLDITKIQKDVAHCRVDARNQADPDDYRTTFSDSSGWFFLPALAIPLNGTEFFAKKFVCPPSHVEAMKKALQDAENLLIIGWSGNEKHLNELLKECFDKPRNKIRVCNSTPDGCKRAISVLKGYLQWPTITSMEGGFSSLLQAGYADLTGFLD